MRQPDAGLDAATVDQVDAALVAIVRWVTRPHMAAMLNDWAGVEIERSGFTLLARIEALPDAHLAQVAEAAQIGVSTASRQVARLVELGLVMRSTDPTEHRARRHRLTADGEATLRRLRAARHDWLAGVVSGFAPDERQHLADLMTRFADALTTADDR